MAITNPGIEDGFDLDSNNLLALGTLVDDGYATNEIPKSGNINTVFKDLYRYMQHLKDTGISQWDNTTSYEKYSRIMRDGILYSSLSDANQGNDPLSTIGSFWEIDMWMMQTTTHNFTADADYTLTSEQNLHGRIVLTDTGVLLTAPRNVITDNIQKSFIVQNDTLQDITVKTLAGTGILVSAGTYANLYNDSTSITSTDPIPAPQYIKAWVKFVGVTAAIQDSFNVQSVTRTALGKYTIVFINPMSGIDYFVGGSATRSTSAITPDGIMSPFQPTASQITIGTSNANGGFEDVDAAYLFVMEE